MCDHSSRANLSPQQQQQEEQATLLSCQLAFLAEASKKKKCGAIVVYGIVVYPRAV